MSKPLVVLIPHQLGRAGAKARLEGGLGQVKARFADKIAHLEEAWRGDRLDVALTAIGQTISAGLDVEDDHVRVEVKLPWMLAVIANKAKSLIEKEGTLLLEKKK